MTDRSRDISGQRFGSLTARSRSVKSRNGTWKWLVECDCGSSEVVFITQLTSGTKTCCKPCRNLIAKAQRTTHGMRESREYNSWKAMKARCLNPAAPHFDEYGGRGISVCPQWLDSFETFFADMGARPENTSLERIEVNGDYAPGNCRWATAKEQAANRRNTRTLTACGETLTLIEWSRRTGIGLSTLYERIKRGWTPERTISETAA